MSTVIEKVKLVYILTIRNFRKIFFFLPINKKRVFFEAFAGSGYRCNPKYISEELHREFGDKLDIVWALRNIHNSAVPDYVRVCRFRSLSHFFYRFTSKVYVCNYLQIIEIPKRKKQVEIQTWHGGGCYKRITTLKENSANSTRMKRSVSEADYFIASSQYFEDHVIKEQLNYSGKILEIGMPRNDFLVNESDRKKKLKIREAIGVGEDVFVVMYAPTWRAGMDLFAPIDVKKIQTAFEKRFNCKCQILFRTHLYGTQSLKNVKNVTDYEDNNELLSICDAVITDYSSLMWDFSLTGRPCFLYTPDLEDYSKKPGFDRDIFTWGFPVCTSNMELENEILNFDALKHKQRMNKHQNDLKSFEIGNATKQVVNLIGKLCR